jgi:uncharacterized protein YndB with AHSA1/START domain
MSEQTSTNHSEITTPAEREIRIERVFDADRERVFAAFTDPELIPQWWGTRTDTTTVEEMDVKPGGRWKYICSGPDSDDVFSGVYREVTPPENLVYTFEFGGMPGHVIVEHVSFEDLGGRTRVVTLSQFHTPEERDGMLASGMEGGLNETYERLDELLARG